MKEFIEFIAKHLVDNPMVLWLKKKLRKTRKLFFLLKVQADDVGKVIGKQGKTAQAMRTLLTAVAAKEGKRAILGNSGLIPTIFYFCDDYFPYC